MSRPKGDVLYPEYVFDTTEPIDFGKIVKAAHGLSLGCRTFEEIEADHAAELDFGDSRAKSLVRHGHKRYESRFVVNLLDELADQRQRVSDTVSPIAMQHVALLAEAHYWNRWNP